MKTIINHKPWVMPVRWLMGTVLVLLMGWLSFDWYGLSSAIGAVLFFGLMCALLIWQSPRLCLTEDYIQRGTFKILLKEIVDAKLFLGLLWITDRSNDSIVFMPSLYRDEEVAGLCSRIELQLQTK